MQLLKKSGKAFGKVFIHGSKSISNRVLIIRELSRSNNQINNLSLSDDTQKLHRYIKMINICNESDIPMILNADNAGTVSRFLTAFLAYQGGTWLITGNSRMKERPIKGLVNGLRMLKANISYADKEGFLPLLIKNSKFIGGNIEVDVTKSSQFISAIMMISPYLHEGLKISFVGKPVSLPYIEMTKKLMQKFGVSVNLTPNSVQILNGEYQFHTYDIESDWSSASYWYETVALAKEAKIVIPGLRKNSLQGDSVIANVFEKLGVKTTYNDDGITITKSGEIIDEFSFDYEGCPDIVPAVMATCAALKIKSTFKNIGHLAYKESNRIEALAKEFKKIGASLIKDESSYILSPYAHKPHKNLTFNTHNDHRIAMCMAPLVLKYDKIDICTPDVVKKSYPEFWEELKKLNFAVLNISYEPIRS